jgi:alpha-tubulin suppressor-like RCC1 family protein
VVAVGEIYGWGDTNFGQLGINAVDNSKRKTPLNMYYIFSRAAWVAAENHATLITLSALWLTFHRRSEQAC